MANNVEKPLLENEEELYVGEKDPESKYGVEEGLTDRPAVCGVPAGLLREGVVMGEPVEQPRQAWSTGLCCCLGSNDEFCGSDLEVCVLGAFAPCVLYGSNMERLYPGRSTFVNHCMAYESLRFLGSVLFSGNICLAPCFSFASRTALRRSHNLEGYGESFVKASGCCTGVIQSEESLERLETACDFGIHYCCHPCSLCQEGREIRRRTVHPAHGTHHYTMAVPTEQSME